MIKKVCSKCHVEKDISEFRKDRTKKDGYYSSCKECKLIYRRENKILVNLAAKKLRNSSKMKDPEKFYEKNYIRHLRYYNNNKENILKRRKDNIVCKLRNSVRARIRQILKIKNISKTCETFEIIGCSPKFLKSHLEKQFCLGMTWDNYGFYGWHIDHITPLSQASNKEDLYRLCHYTNLQPLWSKDNWIKSNKLNIDL